MTKKAARNRMRQDKCCFILCTDTACWCVCKSVQQYLIKDMWNLGADHNRAKVRVYRAHQKQTDVTSRLDNDRRAKGVEGAGGSGDAID